VGAGRARARETLLTLLANETGAPSNEAEHLPEAVARLAVTAKDRASARQALLTLLAVQAPRKADATCGRASS
jgi:hypothetical protein